MMRLQHAQRPANEAYPFILGSAQCPHSARIVPIQCPHSARTVPAGKTQYIACSQIERKKSYLFHQNIYTPAMSLTRDVLCFTSGHCVGTVRALCGHCDSQARLCINMWLIMVANVDGVIPVSVPEQNPARSSLCIDTQLCECRLCNQARISLEPDLPVGQQPVPEL